MSAPQSSSIETARAVVGSLIAGGVTRVAYCPGSRNAPLAYTLAAAESAGQLYVETIGDERSAGFWAVGASIGGGRVPVAVMTTSGTAVAELHAALVEARYQGLPVIAVTADRPHELRGVGASQTIDQEGIFGRTVLASVSLPADATWNDACHQTHRLVACAQGRGGTSGPVHLNVAFRDPLVPTVPVEVPHAPAPTIIPGGRVHPEWDEVVASDLATLVVAGDSASPAVARAAAIRRIPVIAEPSSGVWNSPTAISHGPLVAPLIHDGVKQVVVTGRPTLSRPVQRLINDPGIRKVVVAPRDPWTDVAGTADVVVHGLVDRADPRSSDGALLARARSAEQAAEAVVASHAGFDLLGVCREIWASAAPALWLGASNSIRGFDLAATGAGPELVAANRGAAGIDGTIASAAGFAAGAGTPVRAVMGDLTFAADLSTLTQTLEHSADIQVIVLNDGGGSIFASLEHGESQFSDIYDRYFAVAPRVSVTAAARACGWEADVVSTLDDFRGVLTAPIEGRRVVEVPLRRPAELIRRITREMQVVQQILS